MCVYQYVMFLNDDSNFIVEVVCDFLTNMSALACFHGSGSLAKINCMNIFAPTVCLFRPEKYNQWKRFGPRVRQKEFIQFDSHSRTLFLGPQSKGFHAIGFPLSWANIFLKFHQNELAKLGSHSHQPIFCKPETWLPPEKGTPLIHGPKLLRPQ